MNTNTSQPVVTAQMLNDAYCHIEETATEYMYLDNVQRAKYQMMADYLNQILEIPAFADIPVTMKIRCKNWLYRRQLAAWNWLARTGLVKHHWF